MSPGVHTPRLCCSEEMTSRVMDAPVGKTKRFAATLNSNIQPTLTSNIIALIIHKD